MTDHHIHIGQFEERYYPAGEVFEAVFATDLVDRLVFSSTTSCVENVRYRDVAAEIEAALKLYSPEKTIPLLWYIPDYIRQGLTAERAFSGLPFGGIKLHPYAQRWDFSDPRHSRTLHGLFDYAAQHELPVLIHTGHSGIDSADRFEPFFARYPAVRCTLAHCRPLDTTLAMLGAYQNVYCDTAFVPEEDVRTITANGFAPRILSGSDFPITHYFKNNYPPEGNAGLVSLAEQYACDTEQLRLYNAILANGV
jgi:predicted TIM-barrel fold metal-dependent hydrolase